MKNNDPGYFTFFPKEASTSFMNIPTGGQNADNFPTNASVIGDSACQSRDDHHENGSQTVNHGMSEAETPTTM